MARKPRFSIAGVPQHVIQRGNNREACFYCKEDYHAYLDFLDIAAEKSACQVHAYVLMTNHVHMLITPMKEYGISALLQSLGKRYVQYINSTYKRTGTFWEGRYKASLIDSEAYLLTCMRYIELNPVRANMVETPGEYPWSSYRYNAFTKANNHIVPHPIYTGLGVTEEERCCAYRELFRHKMDGSFLHEIRETTNQELVLGREDFKDRIAQMVERKVRKGRNNWSLTPFFYTENGGHTIKNLTDALSVQNLLYQLDNTLTVDTVEAYLEQISNKPDDSLEGVVNRIAGLFEFTTDKASVDSRDSLYKTIVGINTTINDTPSYAAMKGKYSLVPTQDLAPSLGDSDDLGLAYRYSLLKLMPFAVTGDALKKYKNISPQRTQRTQRNTIQNVFESTVVRMAA